MAKEKKTSKVKEVIKDEAKKVNEKIEKKIESKVEEPKPLSKNKLDAGKKAKMRMVELRMMDRFALIQVIKKLEGF